MTHLRTASIPNEDGPLVANPKAAPSRLALFGTRSECPKGEYKITPYAPTEGVENRMAKKAKQGKKDWNEFSKKNAGNEIEKIDDSAQPPPSSHTMDFEEAVAWCIFHFGELEGEEVADEVVSAGGLEIGATVYEVFNAPRRFRVTSKENGKYTFTLVREEEA